MKNYITILKLLYLEKVKFLKYLRTFKPILSYNFHIQLTVYEFCITFILILS